MIRLDILKGLLGVTMKLFRNFLEKYIFYIFSLEGCKRKMLGSRKPLNNKRTLLKVGCKEIDHGYHSL